MRSFLLLIFLVMCFLLEAEELFIMKLSEIDGINDRRNLFMLINKDGQAWDDKSKILILQSFYPDFMNVYLEEIKKDLLDRGFIKHVNMHPDMPLTDEEGNENDIFKWVTTPEGIDALNTNLFPSELKKRNEDEKRQKIKDVETDLNIRSLKRSNWAIWISILAIIISAIALLKELGLMDRWLSNR